MPAPQTPGMSLISHLYIPISSSPPDEPLESNQKQLPQSPATTIPPSRLGPPWTQNLAGGKGRDNAQGPVPYLAQLEYQQARQCSAKRKQLS
ncbi:hypothetical protein PCASD_02513 [Puccinia coronata f. sp. avenae]|uniref:Uncharacterized protein n=1 Tax=Puccinia coronata f. sp. avenae TaxID=200324 RepID=A0A2N5VMB5_9BASI|nr:hypothetical protein PCASD_02513 [Puccinia coronata f. sp. avenae]